MAIVRCISPNNWCSFLVRTTARGSACGTPRHLLNPTGPHDLAQPDLSTSSGRPLRVIVPVQPASLTFAALELPAPTDLIRG
jgi:hypothetical protein